MWAFEIRPTQLEEIYWTHSIDEIRMVVKVRLGWYQAQALQQYQVMAILMKNAFGDGKDEDNHEVAPYNSFAEAQAALMRAFGQ